MTEEEKNEMELNIEAKYVGRTEKEFLNNITFAECLYILDTKNNYCDDIRNLSLLKIVDIINKQQSDIEIKDKVIEEIKSKLQKHINFCEQESRGHLENKVCHISLKFEKNLLEEVEKVGGEDE